MQRGEIHLAAFPYGDTATMKLRPVLILAGPVGSAAEVLAAYVSSVIPTDLLSTDIVINPAEPEYENTKLKATSVVRLHKLATIHSSSVRRYLGRIPHATQLQVDNALRQFLSL